MRTGLSTLVFAFVIAVGAWLVACGDEVLEGDLGDQHGENSAAADDHNDSNDDGGQSPEDCSDDEIFNPSTGKCVEVENGDNDGESGDDDEGIELNDPEPDCDEGQIVDPVSGECVEEGEHQECGPGNLVGTTCRPDGGTLPNATVRLLGVGCDGTVVNELTTADGQGDYEFNGIPAGSYELEITSGSFEVIDDVDIYAGETTNLKSENAKICITPEAVDIAVISGTYDNIGSLLDGMNINHDYISSPGDFFADMDAMRDYDIIFVECGAPWSTLSNNVFEVDMEDIKSNIRRYVEEGNSLYASDLAYRYFRETIPEAFVYYGDDSDGWPTVGSGGQTVTADVVSTEMQNLLNSTTTEIHFNMGGWAVVLDGGPSSEVQFRADVNDGDIEDAALMTIYRDLIGNGRGIYTSFHNDAQGSVGGDMQAILEYMIFQL